MVATGKSYLPGKTEVQCSTVKCRMDDMVHDPNKEEYFAVAFSSFGSHRQANQ
jgi:hypothetical protein